MAVVKPVKNQLYHGDCMEILRQIPSDSVDLVLADPPYGINYKSHQRRNGFKVMDNDQRPYIWWLNEAQRIIKPTGSVICFTSWRTMDAFKLAMDCAGLSLQSCLIWDKGVHGSGDTLRMFGPRHEMGLFGIKDKAFKFPGKRPVDVIPAMRINGVNLIHPAQKPVELLESLIEATTSPGALVVDPFAGCGSSIVAAKKSGRDFIGIEIDEHYFKIASERISAV